MTGNAVACYYFNCIWQADR